MNKELSAKDVVARLRDGMTIGIGGWGPRRKPMAIVRELLRSDLGVNRATSCRHSEHTIYCGNISHLFSCASACFQRMPVTG